MKLHTIHTNISLFRTGRYQSTLLTINIECCCFLMTKFIKPYKDAMTNASGGSWSLRKTGVIVCMANIEMMFSNVVFFIVNVFI